MLPSFVLFRVFIRGVCHSAQLMFRVWPDEEKETYEQKYYSWHWKPVHMVFYVLAHTFTSVTVEDFCLVSVSDHGQFQNVRSNVHGIWCVVRLGADQSNMQVCESKPVGGEFMTVLHPPPPNVITFRAVASSTAACQFRRHFNFLLFVCWWCGGWRIPIVWECVTSSDRKACSTHGAVRILDLKDEWWPRNMPHIMTFDPVLVKLAPAKMEFSRKRSRTRTHTYTQSFCSLWQRLMDDDTFWIHMLYPYRIDLFGEIVCVCVVLQMLKDNCNVR